VNVKVKEQETYNGVGGADGDIGIDVELVVRGLATRVAPESRYAGVGVLL
jgi:hypothetical protein